MLKIKGRGKNKYIDWLGKKTYYYPYLSSDFSEKMTKYFTSQLWNQNKAAGYKSKTDRNIYVQ